MLSLTRIDQLTAHHHTGPLLDELVRNGLVIPLPLRVRLIGAPAGVWGLALRRLLELTYGPTPLADQLSRRILAGLEEGHAHTGWTDQDGDLCPIASAAALSGLLRLNRDYPQRAQELGVAGGIQRGLNAFQALQGPDGLIQGPGLNDVRVRLLATAMVAYLLAGWPEFRAAVRWFDLVDAMERLQDQHDRDTAQLWSFVGLGLHHQIPPSPVNRQSLADPDVDEHHGKNFSPSTNPPAARSVFLV